MNMKSDETLIALLAALLAFAVISANAALEDTPMDSPAARQEQIPVSIALNRQWALRAFSGASVEGMGAAIAERLPFSFVYDGRPSAEFLGAWERQVTVDNSDPKKIVLTAKFTDPKTQLEVKAVATVFLDTPGVDWTLYFTNKGERDSPILQDVKALNVIVPSAPGRIPVLRRLKGTACAVDDWEPLHDPLPPGKRIDFAAASALSALSSWGVCPFFTLDGGSSGVVTAVGWTGHWGASADHSAAGVVRLQAGMLGMRLKLHPGESIRSPRILQLYWNGGDHFDAYNLFRRTMIEHVLPRIDGELVRPPIAHLSDAFYEMNSTTETNILSHLKAVTGLGFEFFWVDAYWTRDGFPACMGAYGFPIDRVPDPVRFPRGMKAIGDAVEKTGMKYLMWIAPETVMPQSILSKEHPEWVCSPAHDGSGTFNLGIPEARDYMTRYLNAVIKEYKLSCWRTDSGPTLEHWQSNDKKTPDREGMTEIRHVEGYYRMWDDVRKANPHLFIDNCCGGGARIDLETSSRSVPLWRTDATIGPLMTKDFNQAAVQNQAMTAGLSRYVPFSVSGQMGATPYLFRSGYNAGISFCEDVRPADYPRDLLMKAIAEGKRIRKYYSGNFYPLTEVTLNPRDWCVMHYHRPVEQDGMVIAFRRDKSPYASYFCDLREIDPAADYQVTLYPGYEPSATIMRKGSELKRFKAEIADCPGSLIVEYARRR